MVKGKSRLLQDQQFSAPATNILEDQAIQGSMQNIIILMEIAMSRRDFDDLVFFSFSFARPERFFLFAETRGASCRSDAALAFDARLFGGNLSVCLFASASQASRSLFLSLKSNCVHSHTLFFGPRSMQVYKIENW